ALTVNGRTLADTVRDARCWNDDVIRPLQMPLAPEGGTVILSGNLCPDGAVLKQSAASPHLLTHRGRAVVFRDHDDLHRRIDDPARRADAPAHAPGRRRGACTPPRGLDAATASVHARLRPPLPRPRAAGQRGVRLRFLGRPDPGARGGHGGTIAQLVFPRASGSPTNDPNTRSGPADIGQGFSY